MSLIVILFSISLPLHSQYRTVDSLINLSDQSSDDTVRISLINSAARSILFTDPDTAKHLAMHALRYSERVNWPSGMGMAYNTLGIIAGVKGQSDSSLKYLMEALAIREKLNDISGASKTLANLGILYEMKADYDQSLKFYLKALEYHEIVADSQAIALTMTSIGINYFLRKDYDKALLYLGQAQSFFERHSAKDQISTLPSMGDIYVKKSQYTTALTYYRRAMPFAVAASDNYSMALIADGIGRALTGLDSLKQAMEQFGLAMIREMAIGNKSTYAGTLANIAEVYRRQGHLKLSTEYAEKSLTVSKEVDAKEAALLSYKILHQNYGAEGRYKEGYQALLAYNALNDSIFNAQKETEINRLLLQRRESENEILRKSNDLKDAKIRQQYLERSILIGIIAVIIVVGLIVTYLLKQKAMANRLLTEKNREIQRQNEERKETIGLVEAINSQLDLDKLLKSIFEIVQPMLHMQTGSVLLKDSTTGVFRFRSAFGVDLSILSHIELTEDEAIRRYVDNGEMVAEGMYFIRDLIARKGTEKFTDLPLIDSLFVIQLTDDKGLAGFLLFDGVTQASPHDLLMLTALKEHIRTALTKLRMLAELRSLNEKKNEFLGIVAHDLRNPLSTIFGYTDLIMEDIRKEKFNPTSALEDLNKIAGVSRHMNRFISELLDISAIESGKVRMEFHDSDLKLIVNGCEYMHQRSSQNKKIQLSVDYDMPLPNVHVDVDKISSVVDNLLSNAIKYTHPGGRVKVYFEHRDSEVVTHVEDTGQGLSGDDLEKVFTSFRRLSSKPTGGEPSTGLGLAIVKKIVELHHGRVWVKSQRGEGSTFSFSLPVVHQK